MIMPEISWNQLEEVNHKARMEQMGYYGTPFKKKVRVDFYDTIFSQAIREVNQEENSTRYARRIREQHERNRLSKTPQQ